MCKDSLNRFIVWAKCCSSDMAHKYSMYKTYGYPEAERIKSNMLVVDSLISALERYVVVGSSDVVSLGVMNLGCDKIYVSPNNSLYLDSTDKKIPVNPDNINCLSEEEACVIAGKIKSLCFNC